MSGASQSSYGYVPNREDVLRQLALQQAIESHDRMGGSAEDIVATAQVFESYLRGEENPA